MATEVNLSRWIVKHPYLVRTILVGLGIVVVLSFLTIPFFNSVSEMNRRLANRKKEAAELAERVTILSGLDSQVLSQRVRTLDQALPPRKDVVLYLSTIDGLSKQLGLNFGGISLAPGDVTEASFSAQTPAKRTGSKTNIAGLSSLDTEVKIDGTRDSIYAFLREIENSVPIMEIKDVQVAAKDDNRLSLSLNLGMLYAIADINQVKGKISIFDAKEEAYFTKLEGFSRFDNLSAFNEEAVTGLGKSDLFQGFGD